MAKKFVVVSSYLNGEFTQLLTAQQVINCINLTDCDDELLSYAVYDCTVDGAKRLHQVADWNEPYNYICFVDDDENVIIEGYGEEH